MTHWGLRPATLAATLALLAGPSLSQPQPPAFPTAEGAGRHSLGGRGGVVIKVTSLADSGPGTLRAAVTAKGPRTVVFSVSGTIQLKSTLTIAEPRITIAGQTAPGDGVTLRDHPLVVAADDVVVRYLRARLGDAANVQEDAVWVSRGRRIILDHISASWSVDETLSVSQYYDRPGSGPYDVTVQWSLIAESLNRSAHDKGQHGYGSLVRGGRGSRFTFHHNLWASHLARMPRPGNYEAAATDAKGAFFDFRNNTVYNWGGDSAGYNADTNSLSAYNFVGNAYLTGPNSKAPIAFKEQNPLARAWFAANSMDGAVPSDPWSLVTGHKTPANRLAAPLPMPPVATQPWEAAHQAVLATAGASLKRDPVDARIVQGVRTKTHRMIDTQADVGGWPQLTSLPAPPDADNDGMPDAWERARRLDPANPADGPRLATGGYTNLELYLNSLAP